MSYIEREAAIGEIEEWYEMYPDSDAAREALSLAKRAIRKLPAADVRPVVLCRDCDCWNVWDRVRDTCSCGFWSEDRLIYTKEKDFCSWGRKRGVDE